MFAALLPGEIATGGLGPGGELLGDDLIFASSQGQCGHGRCASRPRLGLAAPLTPYLFLSFSVQVGLVEDEQGQPHLACIFTGTGVVTLRPGRDLIEQIRASFPPDGAVLTAPD